MAPAAATSRTGRTLRPLRRVLLAAVAGAAWLTLSATAAQADDPCTFYGPPCGSGESVVAADCADADDFPVPFLDGAQVSLDADPAPAGTWAAGAVPGPRVPTADIEPDVVPDVPPVAAHVTDLQPAAAAPEPAAAVPDAPGSFLPAPEITPPATAPVEDPAAAPPVPVVPGSRWSRWSRSPQCQVRNPQFLTPALICRLWTPRLWFPGPAGPLPVAPAAVLPGDVPARAPATTLAAADGASPSAGTSKAGTPKASAPLPPIPAPAGPEVALPLAAYLPPVAVHSAWLLLENRAAAPVLSGAAPPVEPPAGTGQPSVPPATRVRAPGMAAGARLRLTRSRLLRARGPATGTPATGLPERPHGCPACTSICPQRVPTPSPVRSSTSTPPFALIPVLLLTSRAVSASTEHGPSGCLGRPLPVTQEISPWTRPSTAGFPAPQYSTR